MSGSYSGSIPDSPRFLSRLVTLADADVARGGPLRYWTTARP
jgi:hypothetical protein